MTDDFGRRWDEMFWLAKLTYLQQAVRVATQYTSDPFLPRRRPSASRAAEQT